MGDTKRPLAGAIVCLFVLVFLIGVQIAALVSISAATQDQAVIDLMYYQSKLANASSPGCQMSIEEFRRYHLLSDELSRRDPEP